MYLCRDGAVSDVRALTSHQCDPGSIPRSVVICGLSLLVLYSAPRGFSPDILFFLSPQNQYDLICIKSDVISFMHDPTSYMYSALNIIV